MYIVQRRVVEWEVYTNEWERVIKTYWIVNIPQIGSQIISLANKLHILKIDQWFLG